MTRRRAAVAFVLGTAAIACGLVVGLLAWARGGVEDDLLEHVYLADEIAGRGT